VIHPRHRVVIGVLSGLVVAVSAVGFVAVRGNVTAASTVGEYRSWGNGASIPRAYEPGYERFC
jgi:hypothetical protein